MKPAGRRNFEWHVRGRRNAEIGHMADRAARRASTRKRCSNDCRTRSAGQRRAAAVCERLAVGSGIATVVRRPAIHVTICGHGVHVRWRLRQGGNDASTAGHDQAQTCDVRRTRSGRALQPIQRGCTWPVTSRPFGLPAKVEILAEDHVSSIVQTSPESFMASAKFAQSASFSIPAAQYAATIVLRTASVRRRVRGSPQSAGGRPWSFMPLRPPPLRFGCQQRHAL